MKNPLPGRLSLVTKSASVLAIAALIGAGAQPAFAAQSAPAIQPPHTTQSAHAQQATAHPTPAQPATAQQLNAAHPAFGPVVAAPQETPSGPTLTQPTSNPITFPGAKIGAPSVSIDGSTATLSNNALELTLNTENGVAITEIVNNLTGNTVPFTADQLFAFKISGQNYDLSSFEVEGDLGEVEITPTEEDTGRFADDYSGKAVAAKFTPKADAPAVLQNLKITYIAELLDGSNYVRHALVFENTGTAPIDITDLFMVNSAQVEGRVEGVDDGSPIVLGKDGAETAWIGAENPLAKVSVEGGIAVSRLPRANDLVKDSPWEVATTIGVAPESQMRRAFSYYVERERMRARRTFLHFQSWFDLKPGGAKLTIDHKEMLKAEELFFSQMNERDAAVDSYWVDDGWDYLRDPRQDESGLNVWQFDPVEFPNGFEEDLAVMEEQGAKLSIWMSPFGGYGVSSSIRRDIGNDKIRNADPSEHPWTDPGKVMRLSAPKYFDYFRDRVLTMIDSGVHGFKFDGIAHGSLFISGADPSLIADYEALFELTEQMREHEKDVWVNATVGTWGSPYWFWYVDSIYRDGNDAGQAGQGNSQEKYVTYRDDQVHQNMIVESPLVPLNSVMNHGVILSDRTDGQIPNQPHDFSVPAVRQAFANDLKNFFSMGIGLQELYLRNTFFDPEVIGEENANWAWDTIAMNAKWARDNVELLTDTHWVGGDPASGEVYGTAAWHNPGETTNDAQAMIALRNPSSRPAFIALDAVKALEVPAGEAQRFEFTERDGMADTWVSNENEPYYVKLDPFQVLLFEGVPTDKEPSSSEEPDPSLLEIPRNDWTFEASSEQTTGTELDPIENLFDGDASTIWHTQWDPTVDRFPHTVTVDMGRVNEVHRLGYLPRQNQNVTNGDIRGYKLEVSTDGTEWETIVDAGEFEGDKSEKSIDIPEGKRSFRFFRLTATSSQNGNQFAGGAELRAYGVQGKSEWIDRTEWICTASDFEETGEQHGQSGHAKHACDGKVSTQWHSQYNPTIAPMPHWLQVDMRVMTNVEAVRYTPRQDVYPANGIIGKYTLQYSTDGETWTDAVEGEFTDGRPAVIELPETVQARFLRLNALSAQNGAQYAGVAEFDVKGEPVLITPIAPEFIDEDGAESDAYVIPQQDGVIYLINGNAVEAGTHKLAPGQTSVQISATAADGWTLEEGNWMWEHTFDSTSTPEETESEVTEEETESEPTESESSEVTEPETTGEATESETAGEVAEPETTVEETESGATEEESGTEQTEPSDEAETTEETTVDSQEPTEESTSAPADPTDTSTPSTSMKTETGKPGGLAKTGVQVVSLGLLALALMFGGGVMVVRRNRHSA